MKDKKIIFVFVGLIFKNKKILLVQRREKQLPEVDGKWELPGGKLGFNEKIEEAVEREIYEETGYKVKAIKILPKPFYSLWRYPKFEQYTVIFCLLCRLVGSRKVKMSDHHVKNISWFSLSKLKKISLLPGVDFFITQYLDDSINKFKCCVNKRRSS